MNPNIPQYVPSSTSERTKSIQTNPDSDIDMSCDALDTIPGPLAVPACEGDLGFGGRFSTCKPDHVVLETLDGTKLSISKSALSHSSQFFKDMFDMADPHSDSRTPIPTFVATEHLYTLLIIIEDQVDCGVFERLNYEGQVMYIPKAIERLPLKEKISLGETADRFDCAVIDLSVKRSLGVYYDSMTPIQLLRAASKANIVPVAKAAIARMGTSSRWGPERIYRDWWTFISGIRPTWQVELTKVFWETGDQLVERLYKAPEYQINGRKKPRTREGILIATRHSFAEIAAAFNPEGGNEA